MSTVMPCIQGGKHHRFIELDNDVKCLKKSMPNLVEAYVSQMPSQVLDLTGDGALMKVVRILGKEIKG